MAKNSPGDFTGNRKKKLAKEAQLQQAEASKTMSMVSAAEEKAKNAEVVDYTKEKVAAPVDTGPVDLTVTEDDDDPTIAKFVAENDDAPESGTVGGPTDLTAEPVKAPAPVQVIEKQKVLIRAKYDMSQVTIGKGTFYDFEEGRQYYVPPHVAQHLDERDYVDVLG